MNRFVDPADGFKFLNVSPSMPDPSSHAKILPM